MAEFGGSEGGGFEETLRCDEKEVKVGSPEEIEEGIKSTPTVRWDPFRVLPKEIYIKIFNKLDNPMDKLNLMNAHVKWYELFKAERVKFLFGKVFEDLSLLDENIWREDQNMLRKPLEDKDSSDGMSEDDEEDAAPFNQRLSKAAKSLNRLRLVCRDWDQSIQHYYQFHPDYFQFVFCADKWSPLWRNESKQLKNQYPDGYLINGISWGPWYAASRLGNDLDEFRAHPSSKNPILTRKVRIQIDRTRQSSDDRQLLRTLLSHIYSLFETYGRHVWHFSFRDFSMLTQETYVEMVKWLHLMPELRTLQIEYDKNNYNIERVRETTEFIKTTQIELPRMRKLQSFCVSGYPDSALNKLLGGMKALKKVEVADPSHQLKGFKFPTTLTELALKLQTDEDILHLNSLQQFPVVRNLVIDLIDCSLEMNNLEDTQPSWKTVWKAIEEKFPAIEDLHLSLPRTSSDRNRYKLMEQSLDCRLNLKKLKRLSITTPISFCLDFLQEMKTLRELKIQLDLGYGKASYDLLRRERIQFNRDSTTMWESNIWQIFPNLKKLAVRDPGVRGVGEIQHLYEKRAKGQRIYNKIIICSSEELF